MDPVALLATTLQAGFALLVMFVVPGLALGPMLVPGASTPLTRAGRAVGVSLLTTSIACTLLARIGLLSAASTLVFAAAASVVGLVSAWRSGLRPRRLAWPARRQARWLAGAAVGCLVAGVLVLVPSRLAVGDALLPYTSTVWYYANLARAVADTGGFPVALPEWGMLRPFQTDYLAVTAHTAATLQLLPGSLSLQIEVYRLALLAAGLLLATLLFRRWVSTWLALLGSVLLFATARLEFKFLAYKPETFGLLLMLFGLWLLDRALAERSRRLVLAASAMGAVLYLAHAEVLLVYLAFGAALVVARCVVTRRGLLGLGLGRAPRAATTAGLGLAILASGLVGGTVVSGALTGSFRIAGYVIGAASAPGPAATAASYDPAQVPAGWTFSGDPTWDFYAASVAPALAGTPPPRSFFDSRILPRSILAVWPGLDGRTRELLPVLAAFLLLPFAAWRWLDRRRRRAVVTLVVVGAALLAGSYLLFRLSHTYVPMRTGPRRIMPYELLVPVLAGIVALWGSNRLLARGWRALFPRRGSMAASGAALVMLAAAMVWSGPAAALDDPEPGLTPAGYDAYAWISANLPADARILANAYTDGALTALSGRTGIVDGRAVYLEDPAFLHESTALCLGARVVFADPGGPGAVAFLAAQRVGYVLVVGAGGTGSDLGGYQPFQTDGAALASSRRYTPVRTFGEGRLILYRVEPSS